MKDSNATRDILITMGAAAAATAFLFKCGSFKLIFKEKAFTIHSSVWKDRSISYADIKDVELTDNLKKGIRVCGFGSFKLCLGLFRNEEFGLYHLYSYTKSDRHVLLRLKNNRTVAIGGEDGETTEQIYKAICECKSRQ